MGESGKIFEEGNTLINKIEWSK